MTVTPSGASELAQHLKIGLSRFNGQGAQLHDQHRLAAGRRGADGRGLGEAPLIEQGLQLKGVGSGGVFQADMLSKRLALDAVAVPVAIAEAEGVRWGAMRRCRCNRLPRWLGGTPCQVVINASTWRDHTLVLGSGPARENRLPDG